MIRSALRPEFLEQTNEPARILHSQYDSFFKSVITDNWCDSSDGSVEAPCGFFSFISVEYDEAQEFWEANTDALSETPLHWMWSGMFAGYYITTEDSNGTIRVFAFDDRDEALRSYAGLEAQFDNWCTDQK